MWEIPIMLFIILIMIFRFSQCRTNYIASNAGIIWFSAKKCYLIPYLFYIHCYTLTNHHYLLSAHIICTVTFVPFGSLQGVPINREFQWHFFFVFNDDGSSARCSSYNILQSNRSQKIYSSRRNSSMWN